MGLIDKAEEVVSLGKKWYQDRNGDISSLRILVVPAGYIGMFMAVAGTIGMFLKIDLASVAMTAGVGLVTTAMGAKAWQKGKE